MRYLLLSEHNGGPLLGLLSEHNGGPLLGMEAKEERVQERESPRGHQFPAVVFWRSSLRALSVMLPSTSTSCNFRDVPSTDILHACAGIMLELFLSRGDAAIDVVYFLKLVQESRRSSSCLEALVVVGWKLLVRHVPSATSNAGMKFGPGPAPYIQFYRLTPHAIG